MKKIRIHYCGGCNPEYDRVAAAGRLRESGLDTNVQNKGEATLCIALSGCGRRCASHGRDACREVWSAGQMEELIAELKEDE